MATDSLLERLRAGDLNILQKMENAGSDMGKYYQLVAERHALYLKYEKMAKDLNNNELMYLFGTMRQNTFMQVQLSKMEEEIKNLKSRIDNLETKS